jgi:hypothetical protein
MPRLSPNDEYTHPVPEDSNFNESMYFNFYDRVARLGGFVRIGNRPNEGYAEMTLCAYLPDGGALFNFRRAAITDNAGYRAGGLEFQVDEPFKALRVAYDGPAVYLDDPHAMRDPARAFKENPRRHVRLALSYTGLSPMYGGVADVEHPDMTFAKAHYEQHVGARGTLAVDGRETAIDGLGLRDHSWGPRSWQSPKYYRWLTCQFSESFGFMGTLIVTQNGSELRSGFVYRDGENHLVRRWQLETDFEGPERYHQRLRARLDTDAGSFDVSGRVLSLIPLRNRRNGQVTRISEGLTEYRSGDAVGYGLAEYLDQMPGEVA